VISIDHTKAMAQISADAPGDYFSKAAESIHAMAAALSLDRLKDLGESYSSYSSAKNIAASLLLFAVYTGVFKLLKTSILRAAQSGSLRAATTAARVGDGSLADRLEALAIEIGSSASTTTPVCAIELTSLSFIMCALHAVDDVSNAGVEAIDALLEAAKSQVSEFKLLIKENNKVHDRSARLLPLPPLYF